MAPPGQEGWARRTLRNAVGVHGRRNLAAWLVAGSAAYWLYIKPERERAAEQREAREVTLALARERGLAAAAAGDVARAAPRPDPQVGGLVRGSKA